MFEAKLHLSSDDLMLSSALPADKYKLVKYEELVSDPRRTMLDLYSFAGIPVTQQMLVSINQHFNAELLNKKRYTITLFPVKFFKLILGRDRRSLECCLCSGRAHTTTVSSDHCQMKSNPTLRTNVTNYSTYSTTNNFLLDYNIIQLKYPWSPLTRPKSW